MPPRRSARLSTAAVALAATLAALPLLALALRAPWSRLADVLARRDVAEAVGVSVASATLAAVLATLIGVPAGHALARQRGRWVPAARAAVSAPLVVPAVAIGVGLLAAVGRNGVAGTPLASVGIELPFTFAAVVVAQTVVALPFVAHTAEAAFANLDDDVLEVATTLGMSGDRRLLAVEIPLARTAIAAGAALGWARAFGELGATITFAGIVAGQTETLPVLTFLALETDREAATVVALAMATVGVAVMALGRRWWSPGIGGRR